MNAKSNDVGLVFKHLATSTTTTEPRGCTIVAGCAQANTNALSNTQVSKAGSESECERERERVNFYLQIEIRTTTNPN